MWFLSACRALFVGKWFLFLLFSSTLFAQVQSTLQAIPFYEDTTATLRAFNQPVVDSKGNVIVFGTQFGFSCGFNVCGVVVYSIAPNGTPNWIKPDTGFASHAVNQVALGPDNTIYFQDFFSLSQVFAYSPSGSPVPNWPVVVDFALDTGARNLVVDPSDGSILVKSGTNFSFSTFPGQIKSFHPDGSLKWRADFPQMPNNTAGMIVGPNDDIYTFSNQGIILRGADGSFVCSFGSQIAPLAGSSAGVFTHLQNSILKLNSDCSITPIFTSTLGRVFVLDSDNGIVFASEFPNTLIGVRPDGSFWRNSQLLPDHIAVIRNSTLYVIGIDAIDSKLKLFVIDENSGNILNAFDPTGVCGGCGVAVDAGGTIYINDFGSTKIFKISPPPPPTPIVIVVPGVGASTLTDPSGDDQWLSCSSIINLNNSGLPNRFAPLQLDINGEAHLQLIPREFLAQSDTVSNIEKPSNQSLVQCANSDLENEIIATLGFEGRLAVVGCHVSLDSTRTCLQSLVVDGSAGAFLQFNGLLTRLSKEGYDPETWPYDFRRGVPELADDLFLAIQRLSSSQRGRRVVIVAHSMGSIIAASMIQRHPDIYTSGTLAQVISIGAPFGGGLLSYLAPQGWEHFPPLRSASDTKALGGNWTSAYDLLPQWDFVQSWNGTVFTPYLSNDTVFSGTQEFPALPRQNALPAAQKLWNDLANFASSSVPLDRWHAFIGYGKRTEFQFTRVTGLPPGSCINAGIGCNVTHTCWFKDFTDGDGTVPRTQSAETGQFVPQNNRIYVNELHSALPGNNSVINGVVQILKGNSPFSIKGLTPTPPQFNGAPATPFTPLNRFTSCSPVDLIAINSSGESVGDSGVEIHDAEYTKIAGSTQISVPTNDSYILQAKGTALGTFEIVVGQLDTSLQPSTVAVLSGIAGPNSVIQYQVNSTATGVPSIVVIASFDSTLDDISNGLKLGLIDNAGIANSLSMKLKAAQTASAKSRLNILNALLRELNAQTGKHVNGVAAQVLTADINSLIMQLL
jgi:pimeloyl-ACP methyl ester carboxylesterase